MIPQEINFYNYFLRRYLLSDKEINFFEIDNQIVLNFLYQKRYISEMNKKKQLNVISLGSNCLPLFTVTAFNLRKPKEERKPFDLMAYPYKNILNIIDSDFDLFFADSTVSNDPSTYFINEKLNLNFIHDPVEKYEYNLNNFNKALKGRIENFYKKCYLKNTIFFMIFYSDDKIKDILFFCDSLRKLLFYKFSNDNLLIIILNHNKNFYLNNDLVRFTFLPEYYNNEKFLWYNPYHYISLEGTIFHANLGYHIHSFICSFRLQFPQLYV